MKILTLALSLLMAQAAFGSLSNVYIAQTAAGADTGVSCATAHNLTFFNTPGNWGAGAAQIGPGTTVRICGTITAANNATALTAQGSGTAGNPITILFEPGSILQAGYLGQSGNGSGCGGGIAICGRSFITIDGNSLQGIIRNTANGGALANQHISTGIDAFFCTNCIVKDLQITNIYVHVDEAGIDETQMRAVAMTGSNNVISGNVITNCGWCVFLPFQNGDVGPSVINNDISGMGHGIMYAASGTVNGTGFIADGNKFHDTTIWTASGCPYHQDGIHFFGTPTSSMDNLTISNNYFYGDWSGCPTGFIFMEAAGSGTPSNAKSYKVYNNVAVISTSFVNTNGWFTFASGTSGSQVIVNNTMIGPSATNNTSCFVMQNLSGLTFRDNLITSCGSPARIDASTIVTVNNNAYGTQCQNGGNCFVYNNSFTGSFTAWKSACGCDGASVQNNNLQLNADGSLQTGSPARNIGANLSTLATGAAASLQSDTTKGTTRTALARPTGSTAWDAGAYQFTAAAPPTTWTLITSAGTGGTVAPSGTATYNDGTVVTVTATPSSGKVFSAWTGSATGSTNPLSVTMNADKTITANFVNAASPVSITSTEVTSTQVTFVYAAPAGTPCIWRVSESPSFVPLAHDVDPALFPGSNSDATRANTITPTAASRTVTIGRRTSLKGADNQWHPLSLQNNTAHSYDVSCGGNQAAGTFTTTVFGEGTGYEHVPFNSAARWNLATPTIDWASTTKTYNDPLTGTQIRPLTFPGTVGALWNERPFGQPEFYVVRGGNWTNPANILNGTTATFASSGSAGAAIFAGIDPTNAYKCALSGYLADCSVDDLGFRLIAKSTTSNSVVAVCWTADSGLTCKSDEVPISLTTTMTDYGVKFGRGTSPSPTSAGWGATRIERQFLPRKGYGTVDRGAVTLTHDHFAMDDGTPNPAAHLIAGSTVAPANQPGEYHSFASYFDPAIPSGAKVMIAGSSPACVRNLCTVSSIANATTMKIAETVTSASGPPAGLITWANFGLRLRVLSGNGTVSVTFAKYAIATSLQRKLPASGATDQWQRVKTTAGDGKQGFFGVIRDTANTFSTLHFVTTEGAGRTLGVFKPPATIAGYPAGDNPAGGGGGPIPDVAVFDRTMAGRAILFWPQQGTAGQVASFFAAQYDVAGCGIQDVAGYQYFKTTNPTDGYNNFAYPSEQPCITWTNLTRQSQGRDLTSQINAITPGWCDLQGMTSAQCTARFPGLTYFGVVGDYLVLYRALSSQDSPTALFVFDKNGTYSRVIKSWNTGLSSSISPRIATMGIHTLEQTGLPNTAALYTNKFPGFASGQAYAGPFLAPVLGVYRSGGTLDTTSTAIPPTNNGTYDSTCPANSYGLTDCIAFRTKAVPCKAGSPAPEIAESPCPWDNTLQSTLPGGQAFHVDDVLIDQDTGTTDAERFVIIQVASVGSNNVDIVAGRHAAKSYCEKNNQTPQQKTHPNGWRVAWGIHLNGCDNGLIHVSLDTGAVLESPRVDVGGHFDLGEGDAAGNFNMWTSGQGAGDGVSNNLPVASIVNPQTHIAVPLWAGIGNDAGGTLQGKIQAYPSIRGATGANVRLDYKHANPGFGATDAPANSIDNVTALLQPGTNSVYKVSIIGYAGAAVTTYKFAPLQMWAGPWLIRDRSSPNRAAHTITDATPWDGCLALRAGECRTTSAAGDLYMSVPKADLTGSANTAAFGRRTPSAIWAVSHMGWIIESKMNENLGDKTRRITMALSFAGWSEAFSNARILPDGSGLAFHLQSAGSQRQIMWAKLGTRTQTYTTSRVTWQPVVVTIPANAAYNQARVAFGYGEYGAITDHFCTPRLEACFADEVTTPFAYEYQASWKACSTTSGCTVTINALPGRTIYFRIERGTGSALQLREAIQAKAVF